MKTIHIANIVIKENRQRQEFDAVAIGELSESIRDLGLMHAPVLRLEGEDLVLVAGESRIKAMEQIWELGDSFSYEGEVVKEGEIPYTTMGELSFLDAEEAELDENLKRRDLTWQEHASAVQRLHLLRAAQVEDHNAKVLQSPNYADDAPLASPHSVADTALEVLGRSDGGYQDKIRKEILVAKHLHQPEIKAAKSAEEAFKILKAQEVRQQNIALAAEVGKDFTSAAHTLLNADCLEWMEAQLLGPTQHFDVILTDPPYGMNAQAFGNAAGKLSNIEHHYDDTPESWAKLLEKWAGLAYRIAAPKAHAYVFCDIDRFHQLKSFMEAAGWYVFRTPLIVHKLNSGRVPLPDRGPRRSWEMILYAIKGEKPVTHIYPDVIPCQADENMSHGAQKPVALFQNLLQRSVCPGDRVLDTFAGSGTIFPAAHTLKCRATGLEINPNYYAMALKHLATLDNEPELPL